MDLRIIRLKKEKVFDGTGESSHRRVGVLCKCESERIEQEKEEIALREHQQTVKRLQSVCFKSQAKTKQTFELATKISIEILEKANDYYHEPYLAGSEKSQRSDASAYL